MYVHIGHLMHVAASHVCSPALHLMMLFISRSLSCSRSLALARCRQRSLPLSPLLSLPLSLSLSSVQSLSPLPSCLCSGWLLALLLHGLLTMLRPPGSQDALPQLEGSVRLQPAQWCLYQVLVQAPSSIDVSARAGQLSAAAWSRRGC